MVEGYSSSCIRCSLQLEAWTALIPNSLCLTPSDTCVTVGTHSFISPSLICSLYMPDEILPVIEHMLPCALNAKSAQVRSLLQPAGNSASFEASGLLRTCLERSRHAGTLEHVMKAMHVVDKQARSGGARRSVRQERVLLLLTILRPTAAGCRDLCALGLVHGDLKPRNVAFRGESQRWNAKFTDFTSLSLWPRTAAVRLGRT